MIDRGAMQDIAKEYDSKNVKIGVLASHSALDIADGAIDEGFGTVLYAKLGRHMTYSKYFKSLKRGGAVIRGMVDECRVYDSFTEMVSDAEMDSMIKDNVVFIPNRSFTSYIDIDTVEDAFRVPMVGSRNMLSASMQS